MRRIAAVAARVASTNRAKPPLTKETVKRVWAVATASAVLAGSPAAMPGPAAAAPGQAAATPGQAVAPPISVFFASAPIQDVLFTFAEFADRSIVSGPGVQGVVSAEIRDQPWDVAFEALLDAHGLVARELDSGIIRVDAARNLFDHETVEPLGTRAFRPSYAEAAELLDPVAGLLTDRGRASIGAGANAVVVTDVARVLDAAQELVETLDVPAPQVDIAAKIVFVNRTGMEGFGVTYDLKDLGGNQLNLLTPGIADKNGDGVIELPSEQVPRGTNVVSLGGASLAALGNALDRVANPTLTLLGSLVMGRSTLVGFIEALKSAQLTEVEARPSVRVLDNRTAKIVVGEETPVRVVDAGALSGADGREGARNSGPVATVDYKETGVILEVTPRVAGEDVILLDLAAERSSADLGPSDVGLIFRRQKAESKVLARDGETVVIGGLTVEETSHGRSGIPLLMDIPLLGALFRTTTEIRVQRDLLILVTPTIVRPAQDIAKNLVR